MQTYWEMPGHVKGWGSVLVVWGKDSTCVQGVGRHAPDNMSSSPLTCLPFLFPQKSELDEWAAAMNAEFEAAEQFDLLVE